VECGEKAGFTGLAGLLKILGLDEGVGVKKKTGQRKLGRKEEQS